jgi:hypothetical protein
MAGYRGPVAADLCDRKIEILRRVSCQTSVNGNGAPPDLPCVGPDKPLVAVRHKGSGMSAERSRSIAGPRGWRHIGLLGHGLGVQWNRPAAEIARRRLGNGNAYS